MKRFFGWFFGLRCPALFYYDRFRAHCCTKSRHHSGRHYHVHTDTVWTDEEATRQDNIRRGFTVPR